MAYLRRMFAVFAARRATVLGWVVVIALVTVFVAHNHAVQVRTAAALASSDPDVQRNMVRELVQQGRLSDALASTVDPSSEPDSAKNLRGLALRQHAAVALNALVDRQQVSDQDALASLFLVYKDPDLTIEATATAGLATLGKRSKGNQDQIVANLSNGDPGIRAASVAALDAIGGVVVAGQVDKLMQSPDAPDSAQAAMQGLGNTAVPFLLMHMHASDPVIRQSVIRTLGAIGSPSSLDALEKAASDPDPSIRRLAQSAIGDTVIFCYGALRVAQTALDTDGRDAAKTPGDLDADRKALAAAQLVFGRTKRAGPVLIAVLRNVKADSVARTQSALALGRIGGGDAVNALVASLGDYDLVVRDASLQGVESVGGAAVGPLTAALELGDETLRVSVARALGAIGGAEAVGVVRALVGNRATRPEVRLAAVEGLGQGGSVLAVPVLVAALADPDGGVVSAASAGLLSPGLEGAAVPGLVALFDRASPVPFNASQTLARMGGLAVGALREASLSPNVQVQTWAAVTLGLTESRDPSVAAALVPLTRSGNGGVRYVAVQALGRLAGG